MSFRDKLSSAADALGRAKVQRDEQIAEAVSGRPSFVPKDWPDGVPFVSLSAAYYDPEAHKRPPIIDGVRTVRRIGPNERLNELSDAQRAGAEVEQAFAAVQAARDELASLGGKQ